MAKSIEKTVLNYVTSHDKHGVSSDDKDLIKLVDKRYEIACILS